MPRPKYTIVLPAKPCAACQQMRPIEQFASDSRNRDGHAKICLACKEEQRLALPQEKPCTKCGAMKKLDEYPLDKRNPDGHWNMCTECVQARTAIYNQSEEGIATRNAWRAANPDKMRASNARGAARQAKWRETHKEHLQTYFHERYLAESEQFKEYQKTRRLLHPDKMREHESRKRALKAAAPVDDLSEAQFQEICIAFKHRCAYCGKKPKKLTREHVTPYKHQGSNTLWNVIPACHSCNSSKRTGPPPVPVQPLLLTIAPARKPKKRA